MENAFKYIKTWSNDIAYAIVLPFTFLHRCCKIDDRGSLRINDSCRTNKKIMQIMKWMESWKWPDFALFNWNLTFISISIMLKLKLNAVFQFIYFSVNLLDLHLCDRKCWVNKCSLCLHKYIQTFSARIQQRSLLIRINTYQPRMTHNHKIHSNIAGNSRCLIFRTVFLFAVILPLSPRRGLRLGGNVLQI